VQLIYGIAAIHEAGWIHRDIKTSNVLMDATEMKCKVADLGIARPIRQKGARRQSGGHSIGEDQEAELNCARQSSHSYNRTSSCSLPTGPATSASIDMDHRQVPSGETTYTEIQGTLAYMSPEAKARGGHYGKSTDIFSLGCLLTEILMGRKQFQALSTEGISGSAVTEALATNESAHCQALDADGMLMRSELKSLCVQMVAACWEERPSVTRLIAMDFLKPFAAELLQRAPGLNRVHLSQDGARKMNL
jgi:serine/threonine protein kinase